MRFLRNGFLASIALLLLTPVGLLAQNVSPGTSAHMVIGQQAVVQTLLDNTSQGWFDIQPRAGRSYCASAMLSLMSRFASGLTQADTFITIYRSDGTTVVTSNDDIVTEPDGNLQSRACFVWPAAIGSSGYIKVTQLSNVNATLDVRIIETTMFCPWFFIAGDYNAFTLIRNTTDQSVNFTINWRNSAGAIVGTTNGSVPGNGNGAVSARDFVNPAATISGSIELVHNGSEDALKASTTTLSGTTGIGFDALFEQRRSQ